MKHVNTTGWHRKVSRVQLHYNKDLPLLMRAVAQEVNKKTIQNLSGPQIKPGIPGSADPRIGQMPIPRRTAMAVHSIHMKKINPNFYAIYGDKREAPHIEYVHNGTSKMKPRRFLLMAIIFVKYYNYKNLVNKFKKETQKIGRS